MMIVDKTKIMIFQVGGYVGRSCAVTHFCVLSVTSGFSTDTAGPYDEIIFECAVCRVVQEGGVSK